ncbi:rhomboid family intramembrane serine protease [Hymenobacter algoricola]|uniref:Rhomboid family intramembrane serine protease n=1 Tax=Hymenobacter algoricola TaxID=486267 RepID=A0ABP7N5V7_9BACT
MLTLDVTTVLMVLTAGISMYAWSNQELMESWIMRPYVMRQHNEWYRLLTSGFLHANWSHLLFNMFAFYSFGQAVQDIFVGLSGATNGLLQFLALYLGGIVVSDLPTYFRHRQDPDYRSLGASGGVASIIFAAVIFSPTTKIGLLFLPPQLGIPGFIFGFLYLAYSYYQGRRSGDNINHDAHFYGALYGVVLTLVLYPAAAAYCWGQIQAYLF